MNEIIYSVIDSDRTSQNLSFLLDRHSLTYITEEITFLVGLGIPDRHRMVYISVIRSQILELSQTLIPWLSVRKITFRIIKNMDAAKAILNGKYGTQNLAKIFMIYLPYDSNFSDIVNELIDLTSLYQGPNIPGHLCHGGCVHSLLDKNGEIAVVSTQPVQNGDFLNDRYLVVSSLKAHVKGDVLKCSYFKKLVIPAQCVIKEGRKYMWSDDLGRDIKDRLHWQQHVHFELSGCVNVPQIRDMFEQNGNTYLVMDFIKGKTLTQVINEIYKGRQWQELPINEQVKLFCLLLLILESVSKIHARGYVHRDLTPENWRLSASGNLYLMDMEMSYCLVDNFPDPPFQMGTEGYMSPEQQNIYKPTVWEDIYGLGALMIVFFSNQSPVKYIEDNLLRHAAAHNGNLSIGISGEKSLDDLILRCMHPIRENRPELSTIIDAIDSFLLAKRAVKISLFRNLFCGNKQNQSLS